MKNFPKYVYNDIQYIILYIQYNGRKNSQTRNHILSNKTPRTRTVLHVFMSFGRTFKH